MKRIRLGLYALTIADLFVTHTVLQICKPPYTTIGLFGVLLVNLFLRARLKYRAAVICNETCGRGEERGAENRRTNFRNAVVLQLWLWKTRLWRYAIAFLPSVCLHSVSDRLLRLAYATYDPQVMSTLAAVFSYIFLLLGVTLVELFMCRYMAVWYLLPQCRHVKQALRCAKSLALYRTEEVAELCLHTPIFSPVRAAWVARQLKRSKHAYNFLENTNTVNGTFVAEINTMEDA